MTTPGSLEKRVRRLENDVHDAYAILTDVLTIQKQHTNQLVSIEGKLDGHDVMLGVIESRLDGHDARFDSIDARFDAMDFRFDAMDSRFDAIDGRFDSFQNTLVQVLELVQHRG